MGTPIYKISEYIDYASKSPVLAVYGGSGGIIPPVGGGLDGAGAAGQVAFWLDENILVGDNGMTYEIDSSGESTLTIMDGLAVGPIIIRDSTIKMPVGQSIYISPGAFDGISQSGWLYLGDPLRDDTWLGIVAEGSAADVSLTFQSKGLGSIGFGTANYVISVYSDYILLGGEVIRLGLPSGDPVEMSFETVYEAGGATHGGHVTIKGGDIIATAGSNLDGGNLYLCGGVGANAGVEGNVIVSNRTASKDIYAHDFILIP